MELSESARATADDLAEVRAAGIRDARLYCTRGDVDKAKSLSRCSEGALYALALAREAIATAEALLENSAPLGLWYEPSGPSVVRCIRPEKVVRGRDVEEGLVGRPDETLLAYTSPPSLTYKLLAISEKNNSSPSRAGASTPSSSSMEKSCYTCCNSSTSRSTKHTSYSSRATSYTTKPLSADAAAETHESAATGFDVATLSD